MDFNSEYLDNLTTNVDNMDKNLYFMKEQLVDFSQIDKLQQFKIRFTDCHVAISKNGGLIAYCVKGGHFVDKIINKKIVVMFQNAEKRYSININKSWDNSKKFVICLDFTPKQDLYAILNDGKVYKVSYNLGKLKQKLTPSALSETGLISAKFFEKGFIALTKVGEFYYIKDFKNMFAIKMFTAIPPFINIDDKADYMPIPAENTESGKIELLITKQESNGGIIVVPLKEDNDNIPVVPYGETGLYLEIVGISHVTREATHKLVVSSNMGSDDKNKKGKKKEKEKEKEEIIEPPKIENAGKQKEIGMICAIAVSPTNEKVAFYNRNRKCAYLFNSNFEGEYKVINFDCEASQYYNEYEKELKEALEYREGCQFLFCGEDTLAMCWQRVIILSKVRIKEALVYITSEENIGKGKLVSKCITEIDGLRLFTNDGIFLISKVPKELYNISDFFSKAVTKKLIDIYKNTLNRKYTDNKDIRSLSKDLPEAIMDLQRASAYIFWTENNNEENQKETQLYILKVAQFMKKFVDKEEMNFIRFNQICKEMRIVNNLRNDPKYPVLITFKEYVKYDPKDLISILIKYRNFQLAANICKFLDYPMKKVLNKYVMAVMKREIDYMEESIGSTKGEEIIEKYSVLFESLEKVPGISFVKLAKKANKYGGKKLAMYLLEQEKSELVKIPMLLQLKSKLDQPVRIAFDSYDFNAVIKVMSSINKGNIDALLTPLLHKYFRGILLYFKIYDKSQIIDFLEKTKNFAEIFYLDIKTFFKQDNFDNRIEAIKECKSNLKKFEKYLKKIEKKNDPLKAERIELFDIKYANKFIEKLEFITNFKNKCLSEKSIIHYSEKDPFRVSVYNCLKEGFKRENGNWIEMQNKTIQYSQKKLNLIKFRSLLELRRPDEIENLLQKTPLKKLGLNPINLAEVYYDYKYYDQAARWLVQVKDENYFEYTISLFKHMKKYKEWLEFVISNKIIDDKETLVNEILTISPGTEKYLEEFCNKYKVNLNR